ncbi:TetR/AcrR family transcriptional regulator [Streptomyces sp. 8K308]|uniref:TetR/AcrR family transcriptional regulator n=1 Tax=Streptomyces sp. 8K308 TaxID=2530388 RepID=UPI00104BFA51|nr:TetR/AcrR family transcriptional regulator [Streptomyces sp. 8K308]TDC18270.1 TetR/AcrR family transcriptional regulator [Streptomyces sp. 8K308]
MPDQTEGSSRRGRLTPERERELLEATLQLVVEVGYDRVTMADVARRTKSSTATLYRQWGSKGKLAVTALTMHMAERGYLPSGIDTGTLRGDLLALAGQGRENDPATESLFSIYHSILADEEAMAALRELVLDPIVAELRAIARRAVERGEIDAGNPAIGLIEHVFFGPLLTERFFQDRAATPALLGNVIDAVLLPALTSRQAAATG